MKFYAVSLSMLTREYRAGATFPSSEVAHSPVTEHRLSEIAIMRHASDDLYWSTDAGVAKWQTHLV